MRSRGLCVAFIALSLTVGACGSGDKSGDPDKSKDGSTSESGKSASDILSDVKAAATSARSVHVTSKGAKPVDVILTKNGQAAGIMTLKGGKPVEILVISKDVVYARTPKTKGKFGKLRTPDAEQVSSSLSMQAVMKKGLTPDGSLKKGDTTTLEGQKAIELRDEPKGDQLFVAYSGHPYPLKLVEDKGKTTTTFKDWDKPVTLKDPAKQSA